MSFFPVLSLWVVRSLSSLISSLRFRSIPSLSLPLFQLSVPCQLHPWRTLPGAAASLAEGGAEKKTEKKKNTMKTSGEQRRCSEGEATSTPERHRRCCSSCCCCCCCDWCCWQSRHSSRARSSRRGRLRQWRSSLSRSFFVWRRQRRREREREREKRNSIEWRESLIFFCLDCFAKKKKKKIPFLFLHS